VYLSAALREQRLVAMEGAHELRGVRAVALRLFEVHVELRLRIPSEFGEAGTNLAIQEHETLREESALLGRELREDLIVPAHEGEHLLAQAAVTLARRPRSDLHGRIRHLMREAISMQLEAISMQSEAISMQLMTHLEAELLPMMNLRAQMQQRLVEGLFDVPVPLTPRLAHKLHRGRALH
jgi:hypothetical protein